MARPEFHSICRLCIQQLDADNGSPIFNNKTYNSTITLPERIKYCSSLEVNENDGFPSHICSNCLTKLNQSFIFRNQCVLASLILQYLGQNQNHSVTDIPDILLADLESQLFTSSNTITDILKLNKSNESTKTENGTVDDRVPDNPDELCNTQTEKGSDTQTSPYTDNKSHLQSVHEIENSHDGRSEKLWELMREKSVLVRDEESAMGAKSVETSEIFVTCQSELSAIKNVKTETDVMSKSCQKKRIKKIAKMKPLGLRRGKRKKLDSLLDKPASYTCDYCQKIYLSEGGWRYHIHTMHNENYQPFICDICGESFKVKKNLEGHKNSVHFRLKLNLCDVCGRGFASKYSLKVHKIWHNDERDFACDVCGTKFRTRGKLNTHKTIHGGPKNFMCHICSRNFRWKKDFEIHMRTHTGEKPYKCSHCGKAFASLTNMKKHERNHGERGKGGVSGNRYPDVGEVLEFS